MDYGKLAYIGLNDVNKRLQNIEKNNKSALTAFSHNKILNQKINGHYFYEIKFGAAHGALSLIGKLKFFQPSAQKPDITLKLNELVCYFDSPDLKEGAQDYLIFAAAQTQSGNNAIKIEINGYQGELSGLDFNLLGENLTSFEPDERLRLLDRESKKLVAHLAGDKIACYASDDGSFDFNGEPFILGEGVNFCICRGYDDAQKTALAYIDAQKNLYFKLLGSRLVFIDDNASSIALLPLNFGYLVVYIKDFKAYYRFIYRGLDVSKRFELGTSLRLPESVNIVSDAPKPILLIKTSDQKIYLKAARDNIFFEEGVKEIIKSTSFI
ncbi:MAG TPA: hypothetical protein VIL03_03740 [Clostridia bacterium]|jgi:hypothetical protein